MQKQRVNLFLDPEIVKEAKILAIRKVMSLSELVDFALRELLDQTPDPFDPEKTLRRKQKGLDKKK